MGAQLSAGTILAERFEIEAILGQGGFGITYKAVDTSTAQAVAIKEYFPRHCAERNADGSVAATEGQEESFVKYQNAFRDEAEALSGFDHPNIVKVFERFEERNTSYFVMTFIDGISLDQLIRQYGALPIEGAMLIAERLVSAVQQIHAQGRLHRDINPNNIMLRWLLPPYESRLPDIPEEIHARFGSPIVLDFGASREASEIGETMTGIGTRRFGAPEQLRLRARQDRRTDIYGLGATLYMSLAGDYPPSAIERAHEDIIVPATQRFAKMARPSFMRAIDRSLQLEPAYRPATIEAFRDELFSDFVIEGWSRPPESFSEPGPVRFTVTGTTDNSSSSGLSATGGSVRHKWPVPAVAFAALSAAVVVGGAQLLNATNGDAGTINNTAATAKPALDIVASVDFLMRQLRASQSMFNEMELHKRSRDDFARTGGLEDMARQAEQQIAQIEKRLAIDRKEARALVDELARFGQTHTQDFTRNLAGLEDEAKSKGRFDQVNQIGNLRKLILQSGQQKGISGTEFELYWHQEVEVLQ